MDQVDNEEKRPVSGRVSINKIPFKRSGSSLEIIPPDDNGDKQATTKPLTNRPPSRPSSSRKSIHQTKDNQKQPDRPASSNNKSIPSNRPPSRPNSRKSLQRTSSNDSIRQTQSAGASGKTQSAGSSGKTGVVNGDVKKVIDDGRQDESRSSSADARMERADTPKKQVLLPSVRRNYEQHGMPKDMALDTILRESLSSPVEQASNQNSLKDGTQQDHADIASKENIDALLERLSMRVDGEKMGSEHQDRKGSGGKKRQKPAPTQSTTAPPSITTPSNNDPYYITHGKEDKQNEKSQEVNPVRDSVVLSTTDAYYTSPGAVTNKEEEIERVPLKPGAEDEPDESSSEDEESEDEDDEHKAPIELLGEFMEAVMDEEWEDAEKLCKMVLIYEADNAEAKQFQPLIEEMLRREREEQLFSGSEEESSDDDSEDDDSDDDEEDSDVESSSSESESEDDKRKESLVQTEKDKEAGKKAREAMMMKQMEDAIGQQR